MTWKFWKKDAPVARPAVHRPIIGEGRLETTSPTWAFINHWANEQIAKAQTQNSAVGLEDAKANAYRGEIRAFKRLLDLAKPQVPVVSDQVED